MAYSDLYFEKIAPAAYSVESRSKWGTMDPRENRIS